MSTFPTGKYHLRLIGAPGIWIDVQELSAAKPIVFGAALYLGLHRGERMRRTQLSAVLWPDAGESERGERSRWLVHQLRQAGLAVVPRASELGMDAVTFDVDALTAATDIDDVLALPKGDVLAGYDPKISVPFSQWLTATRLRWRRTMVEALDGWLRIAHLATSWPHVEALVLRIQSLDESHEGASTALAEVRAVSGVGGAESHNRRRRNGKEPRRSPLVGRQDALAVLLDALDPSTASRRIGIGGPAGIGKTRLLDEFITIARHRGMAVVSIRCGSADLLRPLSLVADIARGLLEVRGALGASPSSVEALRAFLGDTKSMRDDIPHVARRAAVCAALDEVIGALLDERPLAVVIDDAQWAEPGSWAILRPLISQFSGARLPWLFGHRSETRAAATRAFGEILAADGASSDQGREMLWLAPLDHAHIAALCSTRVAPRSLTSDDLDGIIDQAAGIPFVAEALADHWLAGGDISSLPRPVARLVAARLDRLSPDAICLLETIAVLGADARLDGIESVCVVEAAAMLEATSELETAGIIRSGEDGFVAHGLWTEAVLMRIPKTTLKAIHRYAARWLEHVVAVQKSTDYRRYLAVATHWLEAGDPDRAQRSLGQASDILSASGFHAHAAEMLERSAEIAGMTQVALQYWSRAAELWLLEHSTEGRAAVGRIHKRYDRIGREVSPVFSEHNELEMATNAAFAQEHISHDEIIQRFMPCALAVSASPSHRITAATRILARFSLSEMDRSTASGAWHAVEALVLESADRDVEAAMCAAQYFSRLTDQPDVGVAYADRAWRLLEAGAEASPSTWRRVMMTLGECHELAGDYDRAQAARHRLYERGKELCSKSMMMFAMETLIGSALEAGRIAEARPLLTLLGRPALDAVSHLDRACMIHRVVCALEEGNASEARADLEIRLDDADVAPGAMPRARVLAIHAHLALLEGEYALAEALMHRLLPCFIGRMSFMHHPAYVTARCLDRFRGTEAAGEFARRFLREISSERWTPRRELREFAHVGWNGLHRVRMVAST